MQKSIVITIAFVIIAGLGIFFVVNSRTASQSTNSSQVSTSVGDKAPSFLITTLEGKQVDSESLRGQVVVITSSAAWCSTCIMEAQQFAPVYQKYKDEPVAFITIDIDPRDSKDFIQQFKQENNTPWDYTDAQGGAEVTQRYDLNRFEITYVIDREGVIRFKDSVITSSNKLDEAIAPLL